MELQTILGLFCKTSEDFAIISRVYGLYTDATSDYELTHVKVIICGSMFNAQIFETSREVNRLSVLFLVSSHSASQQRDPLRRHILGLQGLCLCATLTLIPLKESLLKCHHCVISRQHDGQSLSTMLAVQTTYATSFALESIIPRGADSLLSRESKTFSTHLLSCVL